jgi:hypothetical protein
VHSLAPGWTDEDYELWAASKVAVRPEALDALARVRAEDEEQAP